jgi:hypothetical protein
MAEDGGPRAEDRRKRARGETGSKEDLANLRYSESAFGIPEKKRSGNHYGQNHFFHTEAGKGTRRGIKGRE